MQDFSDFQILRDRERNGLSNCVVLPELNGSIVSLSLHPSANGGVAFVDLKLYGLPDAKVEAITLSQLFPEQK